MSKNVSIVVTVILIIVNIYITTFFSIDERRIARLASISIYVTLFLIFKGFNRSKITFVTLLMFLISDVLGLYFEYPIMAKLVYFVRIMSYMLLFFTIFRKVKFEKVKPYVLIIISTVILLNLYLLFTLVESASKLTNNTSEYSIILLYGIIVVCTMFTATNYNLRYNTWRSTYFFYAVLAFILSDLSWFCAYFLNYSVLFNADIVFFCLGLFCLLNFAINTKGSEDILLTEV